MTSATQQEMLENILSRRRFSDEMKEALRLIFLNQVSVRDAADQTDISLQKLGRRRHEIEKLLASECPPGWRKATLYYPRVMQSDIDAIANRLAEMRSEALRRAEARSKVVPLKNESGKRRQKGTKKGIAKGT